MPITPGTPVTVGVGITPESSDSDVRVLQRKLRVRGIKVPVNGTFGPRTRAGVRILQRRLKVAVTGRVNVTLLRKLGIKVRVVASTPPPQPSPPPPVVPVAQYLTTFPVVGTYAYGDDFGDPRHQGTHDGIDIHAAEGTPVVAVVDGWVQRLTRVETGLGGIWVWLVDAAGHEYYYAHLSAITPGLEAGQRVVVGQPIGAVGDTGDARGTTPHLHFEIRLGGGSSINPFSDLSTVDPVKRR